MAREKVSTKSQKKSSNGVSVKLRPEQVPLLLHEATDLLHSGQAEQAVKLAQDAVACLSQSPLSPTARLPALELLGEIYVELGRPEEARSTFLEAAALDPEASLPEVDGGGADKFLWLAQLSEEGGMDSIQWFEKGCSSLRREIHEAEGRAQDEEELEVVATMMQKLANALCGAAEVYMTDLSWETDAEAHCEALVTEACLVAPESPEPLQTLASVRISQERKEDARSALTKSLDLWIDLPPEDPDIPDFPTRISLARLLMEAEFEEKAIDVLDRLVTEDDSSIEAWYLGGWCLNLLAVKQAAENLEEKEQLATLRSSRRWLRRALTLYTTLEYEDDRLRQHAEELIAQLAQRLGPEADDEAEKDVWEGFDGDDDDDDASSNDESKQQHDHDEPMHDT